MPRSALRTDLNLSYRLRSADSARASGLVVLLHGVGADENSLAPLADLLAPSLAVALVRSPLTLAPGQFACFAVNFTANGPVIDSQAAEDSRQALLRFVADLQTQLNIAPQRTVIAGFSQGGIMSASVALTEPERVGGFGILSGRILPEITPLIAPRDRLGQLAAWLSHGNQDPVLPPLWADRASEQLAELGIPTSEHRYSAGHELTPAIARQFAAWVTATVARPV